MGDVEGLDKNEMKNVQGKLGTKKREFENSNSLFCGVSWDRTSDTRIFSPLLYRLSYDTSFKTVCKCT
jgi:hypothetical protein